MSKPLPRTNFQAMIQDEVVPAAIPAEPQPALEEVAVPLKKRIGPARKASSATVTITKPLPLKDRCHQMSVYLDPEVYDRLRDIGHEERVKLHALMLEAVDMLLKRRGQPSIKELVKQGRAGEGG